jgi:hypothetical protein
MEPAGRRRYDGNGNILRKRCRERGENLDDARVGERSFGPLEAKAPASLRNITQGRQDDDARRIVRGAEEAEKTHFSEVERRGGAEGARSG